MFLGGEGQRRDRRSLLFVSASLSKRYCNDACSLTNRDSWDVYDLGGSVDA